MHSENETEAGPADSLISCPTEDASARLLDHDDSSSGAHLGMLVGYMNIESNDL